MLKILALGASSALVQETLKPFAGEGASFFLVARNSQKLEAIAADLQVRGAKKVESLALDLDDLAAHPSLLEAALASLGSLDVVLMGHGVLGDQAADQASVERSLAILQTNFVGQVALLTLIANHMEKERRGLIAVIGSVAGDRGRASNYIYGSAMAGKAAFLSGLRNRLHKSGVKVITIKPGFINTPMTAHLAKKTLPTEADVAGQAIYKAMKAGREVAYIPGFWGYIMWVIKHLPEAIFKRLSL
jgi:short-subunit dehydrogenase